MDQPPYRDVTVGDLLTRLARALPDRDALVYGERPRFTFGALEREARTVARGLMALGVEPGERVVLWATNVAEWVVLQFALARGGAVLVTANTSLRGRGIGADDVINMQYTSGTTGFPKGVMLSSRNIVNNGEALGSVLGFTPADRLCLCVPLFHCFGCVIGVLGAFSHGACLCPIEAFDAKRVLETIHRERCTALYGVPTMFIAELEYPAFAAYDLTSLRTGVMAGALCPEPLMRRVM